MLAWLNGPFGGGKTTTARTLGRRGRGDRWHPFDAEAVGFLLRAALGSHYSADDFQDLPAWRRLVPPVTAAVASCVDRDLLIVHTVLREEYWRELASGFARERLDVVHVALDCEPDALRARISADTAESENARAWRLRHVDTFVAARPWLLAAADLVIDTTHQSPDAVADAVEAMPER